MLLAHALKHIKLVINGSIEYSIFFMDISVLFKMYRYEYEYANFHGSDPWGPLKFEIEL